MHRGLCVFSAAFVIFLLSAFVVPLERRQEFDLLFGGREEGHARRLRADDPFHWLSRHINWTATIDWTVLDLPADIRSSYDPVCDPGTPEFHTNNSLELRHKADFTMHPAGTIGVLQVALKVAQVALAWFSAPSLPIPTVSLWKGDNTNLANLHDPKLGTAGPALANVVVPPSIPVGITSTYMAVKMKDRADMGGIGMPWSVDFQVFVFLAQVVQGLVAAWLAFFVGRNNFIWLFRNYSLTFRFEIWGAGLFQVVRLLLTYKAMQRFLGINVTSRLKASRHNWRNTFRFHEYPWRMEDQDDPIKQLERVVWVLDVFSKYLILPTAAMMALFFLPSFVVNLLPGAVVGFATLWAYKRCSCRRSSALQEPLQLEEGRQFEQAERQNLFSFLDDVSQPILVFAFSILCGFFTSMLNKSYLSADTFLCPYSKMVITGFKLTEHFDSLSAYMTTIIVLALVAWILILMMGAVKKMWRQDGTGQNERLSANGWRATLIHAMWVARCNREFVATDEKFQFEALSFAWISGWEDDNKVPSPSERDKNELMDWAFRSIHEFPNHHIPGIGNPTVGAGKCLRKASCKAEELRERCGFSCKQLKDIGYAIVEVFKIGFDAKELREADFSAEELKELKEDPTYSAKEKELAKELREAEYSAEELRNAGFSAPTLKAAGFEDAAIVEGGYSATELQDAGVDAKEVNGVKLRERKIHEMIERAARDLYDAGWHDIEQLESSVRTAVAFMTGRVETATAGATASAAASAAASTSSSSAHTAAPSAQVTEPGSTSAAMPSSVAEETTSVGSAPFRAETAQADDSEVAIGDLVELHGMTQTEYNGKVGVIVRARADTGRLDVELPESEVEKGKLRKTPQIKPSNLRKTQIESGDMVELCNMKTAGMNGTSGRVLRNTDDRWVVQLPQKDFAIKASNLKLLRKAQADQQSREQQRREQQRREQARRGPCAIHSTALGFGVAPCPAGDRQECMWCKQYFCLYHYRVNNDDGFGSFGGHVCRGAPDDANERSGARQGQLPRA